MFWLISELTSREPQVGSVELGLFGSENEYFRTDTVFLHLSEVSKGGVSLGKPLH